MSYTWRELTFDDAILKALENGFLDEDFEGYSSLPQNVRINRVIRPILSHNGLGQVIFRKSFARALWGEQNVDSYPIGKTPEGFFGPVKKKIPAYDYHRMACVVRDDWMQYLKENV